VKDASGNEPCGERDDHAAVFDGELGVMYIFSGYVNGDKSNDMWKFDLASKQWTCLNKGDYKLDVLK